MPEAKKRTTRRRKPQSESFEQARVNVEGENVRDISAQQVSIHSGSVRDITKADSVTITQGGVNAIDAKNVTVSMTGVLQADAGMLEVKQAAIARVQSEEATMTQGVVGLLQSENANLNGVRAAAVLGNNIDVEAGLSRFMLAREAIHVERGGAVVMAAPRIEMTNGTAVLLVAREVNGSVRTLMDKKSALVFGLAAGLVVGLMQAARRARR